MKKTNIRIYARNGRFGLSIYLDISGRSHHLANRRPNGLLYNWLKSGRTLGELRRLRPERRDREQKIFHYAQALIKLADMYLKYKVAIQPLLKGQEPLCWIIIVGAMVFCSVRLLFA